MKKVDVVGTDDIGTASTDDMFAFSQIITAGANPMQVATEIEKEATKAVAPPKPVLDDDQAMAAFSEFVSNGGGIIDRPDPAKLAAEKKKKEDLEKAQSELKDL